MITDGSTCFFWTDLWNGNLFGHQFPELLSFSKDKFITVQNFMSLDDLSDHFHLPLSNEAFDQFTQLASSLDSVYL
jgi:hypothetical protein